ncbi:hypothetical protein PG990_010011 [Apiospora arundinis]
MHVLRPPSGVPLAVSLGPYITPPSSHRSGRWSCLRHFAYQHQHQYFLQFHDIPEYHQLHHSPTTKILTTESLSGKMSNGAQKRYLVICDSEDVDVDLINDTILSHGELVLPLKPDLSEVLTADDMPITSYESPFVNLDTDGELEAIETMRQAMVRENMAGTKAYAVLDSHSAKDRTTCYVTSFEYENVKKGDDDDDDDDEESTSNVCVRCDIGSIVSILSSLQEAEESTRARKHRNEAAIVGGVWDTRKAMRLRAHPSTLNAPRHKLRSAHWRPSPAWDKYCAMGGRGETARPYVPVFRTADISIETLQAFVKEAMSKANNGENEDDVDEVQPVMAFITSLKEPFFDEPAFEPPRRSRRWTSAFPKAEFEDVKLHYNAYVIMDEHTEATRSVLLGVNSEFGGEMQLVRCAFGATLESILGMQETGLCMDLIANEAASDNGAAIVQPTD